MDYSKKFLYKTAGLILLFLLLFLSCGGTPASRDEIRLDDIIPVDPAITIGTLDNGLVYYIRQNKNPENRAELRLAVKAGSINEDDDQKGIAHFLEHMAFNGTENFGKQEIIDFLESLGMRFGPELNAFTSFEKTIYLLQIPTEDNGVLETGLRILCDWAHTILIEEEEVEKERGVIIEEWRMGRGADARIQDKQYPVLFQGSKFAERMPIGDINIIKKADAELIRRFYTDWYRPDLMAVVAVGDFDVKWMEEQIRMLFSEISMPDKVRPRPDISIPDQDKILYSIATDPEKTVTQVKIFTKFPYDNEGRVRDYRDNIVKYLFRGMLDDRLKEITKDPKAPFIQTYAGNVGIIGDKQLFVVGADVKEGQTAESFKTLLVEAERARRHGFTHGELERKKKNIMAWMDQAYKEQENTESADFASEYIRNYTTNESIPGIAYEHKIYSKYLPEISLAEVNKAAGNEIKYENTVVMIGAPEKEKTRIPGKTQLAAMIESVKQQDINPYTDTETEGPLISDHLEKKEIISQSENSELGLITLELPNGVKVILKQTDFKNNEILFTAFSLGGTSLASDKEYISAVSAVPIIEKSGLGNFSQIELEKKLAGVNLDVTPWISELYEGIRGKTVSKDIETCFKLIYLYFTKPRKDPDAFLAYKEQWKTEIENKSTSPDAVFWDTVRWELSREHFRRRPYTVKILDEMNLDTSYEFYKDRFSDAGDFTFFFVGDFKTETILPLIQIYLANLPSTGRTENWRDINMDPPNGVSVKKVKKGLEAKSQVLIVFAGETEWTPDKTLEMKALNEILNIRFREIVREEEGGTYDIWTYGELQRYPDEEYILYIGFGCAPEKADNLSDIVIKETDKFIQNGPTETEMEKMKEILKRENETDLEENNYWLQALQSYYIYKIDPGRILTLPPRVDSLTAENLKDVAAIYMNPSDYTRFVLLPGKEE